VDGGTRVRVLPGRRDLGRSPTPLLRRMGAAAQRRGGVRRFWFEIGEKKMAEEPTSARRLADSSFPNAGYPTSFWAAGPNSRQK
jgi:hypothetical protein